jgi:hypothetical protein
VHDGASDILAVGVIATSVGSAVAFGATTVAVGCAGSCVGGNAVGDALIVGGAVATSGAGVAVGAAPQAAKITPSPIALLNPKILKGIPSIIVSSLACMCISNCSAAPRRYRYFQYTSALAHLFNSV